MGESKSRVVGAREAETILGISRTKLHVLATNGELPGKIVERRGRPRCWIFKRTDVLRLRARGNYLRQRPKKRKQKQLWEQYFGPIPAGFTAAFRDGDRANLDPRNLCLLPLKAPRKAAIRKRVNRIEWTAERISYLRREFPKRPSLDLARELDISKSVLTRQAKKLRLRKDAQFLKHQARVANRLPLGTERVHDHTNTVWTKVSFDGTPYQQWRPKQQVVWESANNKRVPPGFCVVFRDGNKRNFDPSNLELVSRRERAAQGFAEFLSYPEPLQKLIKLNAKLAREIDRRRNKRSQVEVSEKHQRPGTQPRRWTADMDVILCRDYPTKPIEQLTSTLGVSLSSLRQRARRLHVRRSPETIVAEARAASMIDLYGGAHK